MKLQEYDEVLGALNRWIRETRALEQQIVGESKAGLLTLLFSDVSWLRAGLERAQGILIERQLMAYNVAKYEETLEKGVPYGHS